MKKNIKLSRIHCVGCAENLQSKILEVDGVNSAYVDFVKRTVSLDVANLEVVKKVEETIVKFDSSIKVIDNSEEEKIEKKEKIKKFFDLFRISFAVLLSCLGLFLPRSVNVLKIIFFVVAYALVAYEIIWAAIKNIIKGKVLDENFLMTIATLGAFVLQEFLEAVMVMLLYTVGEFLQGLAVEKSRRRVKNLLNIKAETANLIMESGEVVVPVSSVKVNDIIRVKPGEKVPLDCKIIDGKTYLNAAVITGESKEIFAKKGDEILSGVINVDGVIICRVTKSEKDSTVTKIVEMVENSAKNKAKSERFISRFAKVYTPVVVCVAFLMAIIPWVCGANFRVWLYKALTFLVVSCPCALVISIPLGFFAGIGVSARNGILIKGANFIESLAKTNVVIFDKTGTLTYGDFEVSCIYATEDSSKEEVLELVAYAESFSNHRIAKSIVKEYKKQINTAWVEDYQEIAGFGVKARLFMEDCLVGNLLFMKKNNIEAPEIDVAGTVIYLAKSGKFLGYIVVQDKIKEESFNVVKSLKNNKVEHVSMFTGDNKQIASSVAKSVGLDSFYADLLPQDKVKSLGLFKGQNTVFVGDGINDAPVIASADVGVCMGGVGSDASIEVADVVIMNDDISKIEEAIKISRKTKNVINQNIVFILTCKLVVMLLTFMGISGMWLAIFADVGVALLSVLNSLRVMVYKDKKAPKKSWPSKHYYV